MMGETVGAVTSVNGGTRDPPSKAAHGVYVFM